MSDQIDPAGHTDPADPTQPAAQAPSSGYRPDPAADIPMVVEGFFAALAELVELVGRAAPGDQTTRTRPDGLVARLRRRHEQMLADQRHRVIDEASRYNLAFTLAVLAGYRELTPQIADDVLVPLLERALVEPGRAAAHAVTRASLDGAPDPFAAIVDISREREVHSFGAGFRFAHPEDDDDHYTAQVERCYYHDVLRANGAEHLTPVLCAIDANWIDAIDPERDGFVFERPTTIGFGGAHCPFRFRRIRPGDS